MSLSDYTKRSKARESVDGPGNRDSSPATSATGPPTSVANQVAEAIEQVQEAASDKGVLASLDQENVIVDDDPKEMSVGEV